MTFWISSYAYTTKVGYQQDKASSIPRQRLPYCKERQGLPNRRSDGSLDIYIQHSAPQGKQSNWLPSPAAGLFRLNYRIYLPQLVAQQPETLGKYLPPIKNAK